MFLSQYNSPIFSFESKRKPVNFLIKNYMEVLVLDVINELKKDYGLDESSMEFELIQTLALNSLPPKYFPPDASEGEKKSFLLDKQRHITVMAAVARAIQLVKHPL